MKKVDRIGRQAYTKEKAYSELYVRLDTEDCGKETTINEQHCGFTRKNITDALFKSVFEKFFLFVETTYDRVSRKELWYCMRKLKVGEMCGRWVQGAALMCPVDAVICGDSRKRVEERWR